MYPHRVRIRLEQRSPVAPARPQASSCCFSFVMSRSTARRRSGFSATRPSRTSIGNSSPPARRATSSTRPPAFVPSQLSRRRANRPPTARGSASRREGAAEPSLLLVQPRPANACRYLCGRGGGGQARRAHDRAPPCGGSRRSARHPRSTRAPGRARPSARPRPAPLRGRQPTARPRTEPGRPRSAGRARRHGAPRLRGVHPEDTGGTSLAPGRRQGTVGGNPIARHAPKERRGRENLRRGRTTGDQ